MVMVVDMVLAVTEIALATGAVAEFQFGIRGIRSAANHAAMVVGGFVVYFRSFTWEGDDLGLLALLAQNTA